MMLFEFSIDLEDELTRLLGKHHIVVPRPVIEELEFLSEHGKDKTRYKAKSSLKLIKKYDVANMNEDKKGDEAVFHLAQQLPGIVVTNDRELKRRLKGASLHIIYLRGKKRLVFE